MKQKVLFSLAVAALTLVVGLDFIWQTNRQITAEDATPPIQAPGQADPSDTSPPEPYEPPLPIQTDRHLRERANFQEEELAWFELDSRYDYVSDSAHGRIVVGQKQPVHPDRGEAMDLFALLDAFGNTVLDCQYLSIDIAAADMVLVGSGEEKTYYLSDWPLGRPHRFGAFDFAGRQTVPLEYMSIRTVDDMIYHAQNHYYVDENGDDIVADTAAAASSGGWDPLAISPLSAPAIRPMGGPPVRDESHYYDKQGNRIPIDDALHVNYCAPNGRMVLQGVKETGQAYYFVVDANGVPVNDIRYDKFSRNKNNTYTCRADRLYGLWDADLMPMTELIHKNISTWTLHAAPIAEGHYMFETAAGKGIWDQDLNLVIEPVYSTLEYVGELNYAGKQTPQGERFGYLDAAGNEVVPLVYDWAHPLVGGEEFVHLWKRTGDTVQHEWFDLQGRPVQPAPADKWYRLVTEDGAVIIKNEAGQVWWFGEEYEIANVINYDCLTITDERNGRGDKAKYGALDYDYTMITPPTWKNYVDFSITPNNQIAIVDKRGVLNRNGAYVVPLAYDSLAAVDDCTVIAKKDDAYSLLRFQAYAKPRNCPAPISLADGFEQMQPTLVDGWDTPLIQAKRAGLWGLYNADGTCLIPCEFDAVFYSDAVTVVVKDRQIGVYAQAGAAAEHEIPTKMIREEQVYAP